jgi:hypothetical protein
MRGVGREGREWGGGSGEYARRVGRIGGGWGVIGVLDADVSDRALYLFIAS